MGNQRPRRLVCVTDDEKEHEAIREAAGRDVPVHRASDEWEIFPEVCQIVTGDAATLVSGALNRGYGVRPDKWPIRFGLLNNDVTWRGVPTKAMSELSGLRRNRMALRVDECHAFADKNRIRIDKLFDTDCGHHADVESIVGEPPCKMPPAKDMAVDGPPLWVPLADHLSRTVDVMGSICRGIGCGFNLDLSTAARYHDWAKAHRTFKDAFFADLDPAERAMRDTTAWAKAAPAHTDRQDVLSRPYRRVRHDVIIHATNPDIPGAVTPRQIPHQDTRRVRRNPCGRPRRRHARRRRRRERQVRRSSQDVPLAVRDVRAVPSFISGSPASCRRHEGQQARDSGRYNELTKIR